MFRMFLRNINLFNNYFKMSSTSRSKNNRKHIAVEYEDNESVDKKKPKMMPENWKLIIDNIRKMRADKPAAVDNMGCEKCADEDQDEKTQRFQILVALMLSAQTRDETTHAACMRLRKFGFTVANLANADVTKLEEIIKPVGFYRRKSQHIKETANILQNQHDSDVPNDLKELLNLPGVGKKMANIALSSCWDNVVGIGVDVHVHRISNRLNWVSTKTPEKTEDELESWLPREYWKEINLMLVGFGQSICLPINPKCSECLNNKICPYAFKEEKGRGKKKKSP